MGVAARRVLKPWLKESWVIPPKENAEFVCQMEEVLELYTLKYDTDYPLVCFDESSKQLISETITPIEAKPGQKERFDYRASTRRSL